MARASRTAEPPIQSQGSVRELKIQLWSLDRLIPYPRNARTHSQDQIKQIAASMREWGWTIPVLADENGGIIAGHARVMAAELNGYTKRR